MHTTGEYGKPVIDGFEHFSISHSKGTWAVLFDSAECGLDIEYYRVCNRVGIASRFFTGKESEVVRTAEKHGAIIGQEVFFSLWTRREALVKALGLSVVQADLPSVTEPSVTIGGRTWYFGSIDLPGSSGLATALCTTALTEQITVNELRIRNSEGVRETGSDLNNTSGNESEAGRCGTDGSGNEAGFDRYGTNRNGSTNGAGDGWDDMKRNKGSNKDNKKAKGAVYDAYGYISSRMRTVYEVRLYLAGKGYSGDEIQEAVNELIGHRYLDDYEYALRYFEYNREKHRGPARAVRELAERGVDRDTISNAREDFMYNNNVDEYRDALAIAEKELLSAGNACADPDAEASEEPSSAVLSEKKLASIARKLETRGFSPGDIYRVLDTLRSRCCADEQDECGLAE